MEAATTRRLLVHRPCNHTVKLDVVVAGANYKSACVRQATKIEEQEATKKKSNNGTLAPVENINVI